MMRLHEQAPRDGQAVRVDFENGGGKIQATFVQAAYDGRGGWARRHNLWVAMPLDLWEPADHTRRDA